MEALCGSTASLPSTLSPEEKATAIARAADKNVSNREVRELASSLAALPGPEKVSRLREAAARAGVERCGLLELWIAGPDARTSGTPTAEGAAPPPSDPSGQSMADALRVICEAPDKVPAGSSPAAMAEYIQTNLENAEATRLMQTLASDPPGERSSELARIARENGVERCPLAEMK
jgi:hypothetical protein